MKFKAQFIFRFFWNCIPQQSFLRVWVFVFVYKKVQKQCINGNKCFLKYVMVGIRIPYHFAFSSKGYDLLPKCIPNLLTRKTIIAFSLAFHFSNHFQALKCFYTVLTIDQCHASECSGLTRVICVHLGTLI